MMCSNGKFVTTMRVLISAVGSRGDVQPGLALALGLRESGHEVIVSAPPDFNGWAQELKLPFHPAGGSIEEFLNQNAASLGKNPIGVARVMKQMIAKLVPMWFESTLESASGADLIVSCHQFAARSVAEKLGIRSIGVAYQPTLLRSSYHPPLIVPWQKMPGWLNQACWTITDGLMELTFRKEMNRMRTKWGLAPIPSVQKHLFEGAPYFLAADPVLVTRPPDWSRFDVTVTGPWFYNDHSELPKDVEDFLDAGPPPVYVGFGSMPSKDPARLTKIIVEGASGGGRRVLMSKGWAGIGDGDLPPSIKVVHTPMPHHKLFPRLAAVVHHGGSGTTATALRAGIPQVLIPHLMDQFYFAHRMTALGLAPPGLSVGKLSATRLAAAIDSAMALPAAPRIEAATRLRESNGIAQAIRMIESLNG